jgi:hypothetical protein
MKPIRSRDSETPACLGATPAFVAACLALGCANPAVDSRIEALGEEPNPDLQDFQYHRPGQPCVLCHGEYEEEDPVMSVGGTIFQTPMNRLPVEGAVIRIWDSAGETRTATTNCVGNFWIPKEEWDPLFPLHVEVEYQAAGSDTFRVEPMATRISRDGSCATCHQDMTPKTQQYTPGWVYCTVDPTFQFRPVSQDCPVKFQPAGTP